MKKSFKNNRWYFAYACHHEPDIDNIINKPFRTYVQVLKEANNWMDDDTAFTIYYRHGNQWFKVIPA